MILNLTKLSKRRAILSGDQLELYEYEFPYAFNMAPRRSRGRDSKSSNERRRDNLAHVRSEIRRLIECNYQEYGYNPVFLTFTFKENVTSLSVANKAFKTFIQRFTRYYGKSLKYLAIVEFQKRGAVHYHCIFFNLSIEYERRERRERIIANLWGHGYVDIERIRHAKSVSAYVCKYLNKGVSDPRLRGKKSFFTSRALFRPVQFRSESSIDKLLTDDSFKGVGVDTYDSFSRGKVILKTYVRRHDNSL